jgi:hypothetical protein
MIKIKIPEMFHLVVHLAAHDLRGVRAERRAGMIWNYKDFKKRGNL